MKALTFTVLGALILGAHISAAEPPLAQRLAALAGNGAKDCASPATNDVAPGALSEPCLINAFRGHTAAFWSTGNPPTNRALGGVAVGSSGAVYFLESSGGFWVEHQCTEPAVIQEFGWERLRCKESYVAPPQASVIPFRPGGRVLPPKPKQRIEIPAAICDPAGPGRNVQVELVVDTSGNVLAANILAAAKQCHIAELEHFLTQLKLTPGTLGGAPVVTTWFTIIPLNAGTTGQ